MSETNFDSQGEEKPVSVYDQMNGIANGLIDSIQEEEENNENENENNDENQNQPKTNKKQKKYKTVIKEDGEEEEEEEEASDINVDEEEDKNEGKLDDQFGNVANGLLGNPEEEENDETKNQNNDIQISEEEENEEAKNDIHEEEEEKQISEPKTASSSRRRKLLDVKVVIPDYPFAPQPLDPNITHFVFDESAGDFNPRVARNRNAVSARSKYDRMNNLETSLPKNPAKKYEKSPYFSRPFTIYKVPPYRPPPNKNKSYHYDTSRSARSNTYRNPRQKIPPSDYVERTRENNIRSQRQDRERVDRYRREHPLPVYQPHYQQTVLEAKIEMRRREEREYQRAVDQERKRRQRNRRQHDDFVRKAQDFEVSGEPPSSQKSARQSQRLSQKPRNQQSQQSQQQRSGQQSEQQRSEQQSVTNDEQMIVNDDVEVQPQCDESQKEEIHSQVDSQAEQQDDDEENNDDGNSQHSENIEAENDPHGVTV
ncbi:hypothetical protein TRFO_09567 [Tritrichomonas foetus]|uniref:Uncharacterized protein n=1 Tax=Tritrichomonas foetus TaxID=1144522 RepID=A0A1J4JI77_9EUKA|nr:hypothetical protein TRFO_09567 [Tritrichomonas foetus]|eukprot:OHS97283.1 hypothetical protein TRFO_09567 [Tritrichomonas foetus]